MKNFLKIMNGGRGFIATTSGSGSTKAHMFSKNSRTKYIACEINGYQFFLSSVMWSKWFNIKPVTLLSRLNKYSVRIALELDPMPIKPRRKYRKKKIKCSK